MQNIRDLDALELSAVNGAGDIISELEERFPNGEWDGSTFWPNGVPQPTPSYIPLPY